jgi:chromosome partitioning protein
MSPEPGDELLGIFEIAELAGVGRPVVANWRSRDPRFPPAVADLRSGPVFQADQIRRYLRRRRKTVANVISTINLKGGVAKTTTTAALGEMLAGEFGKKVLLVDLDPQTNLTTMMIGEERWKILNDAGHTLAALFKDALRPEGEPAEFDIDKTLQRNVSPVRQVRGLDLLPSSLDLIDVQDRLASMPSGRFYSDNPTDLLRRAVRDVIAEYEYVLIDCPPNLGIVTLNGLRISHGYIIPTIPDVLSTYGIPQIQTRVAAFASNLGEEITELGIVITKFRTVSTVHANTIRRLEDDEDVPPVFATRIPEANQIAGAAEHTDYGTLRQRYGYGNLYEAFHGLASEFIDVVEESL